MPRGDRGVEALRPNYETRERTATSGLGVLALVVALGNAGLVAGGISASIGHDFSLGTTLAYVTIVGSVVAFAIGLFAVIGNRGRRLGYLAMLVAVLTDPLVLKALLDWLGGLG